MPLKITKQKDGRGAYGPMWRVLINDRPSPFYVSQGAPARYREPVEWDVLQGPGDLSLLFTARSMAGALSAIESIARATLESV